MKRIRIEPAWSFTDEAGNRLDPQLFGLLQAIHRHGKLTFSAAEVGISYRHAWNLLNKWAEFFGAALVNLVVCGCSIVNRVKIEVRDEPFFPRDFASRILMIWAKVQSPISI